MKESTVILGFTYLLVAGLLIVQPWFSRKNVLFGVVFGSDAVWSEEVAQKIRRRYLWETIACTILVSIGAAVCYRFVNSADAGGVFVFSAAMLALVFTGTVTFVAAHHRTLSFKSGRKRDDGLVFNQITVETGIPEKSTVLSGAWLLLFLPVFLATLAVVFFGYHAMPASLPTHYSFTAVDAWSPKSWYVVLTPLFIQAALGVILFVCCLFTRRAPASVRGNPEAAPGSVRFRKYMLFLLIASGVLMQLNFLLIEIGFLTPVSPLWFAVQSFVTLVAACSVFYLYFRFVRVKKPKGLVLDDDAKWILGMFYYNPSDPSVFVEKRAGIGFTVNFARPAAWVFFLGILVFAAVTIITSGK